MAATQCCCYSTPYYTKARNCVPVIHIVNKGQQLTNIPNARLTGHANGTQLYRRQLLARVSDTGHQPTAVVPAAPARRGCTRRSGASTGSGARGLADALALGSTAAGLIPRGSASGCHGRVRGTAVSRRIAPAARASAATRVLQLQHGRH
jgi:hypothetical protein